MDRTRFRGSGVALLTPFHETGEVDLESLRSLVDEQIQKGTHYLVACGSTGEAGTLTPEEQKSVVEETVSVAAGRVPVVVGAGALSTRESLKLARAAREAGADAVLAGTPPYSKPPQSGLYAHFRALAEQAGLPIIVYNVPGRTGVNLLPETVLRLAELDTVWGVKEASGDPHQISTIIRDRPEGFLVIVGDDELAFPVILLGADGVISVIANEVPAEFSRMVELALEGRVEEARTIHYRLLDLMRANFHETNPIPAKAAMASMGKMTDFVRPPLVPASLEARRAVEAALERAVGSAVQA